jgi:hypothetical protein
MERLMIGIRDAKVDDRPKRGAWAPGEYICLCAVCGDAFIGDKRAMVCADCSYQDDAERAEANRKRATK